jgi:hypothetical protein
MLTRRRLLGTGLGTVGAALLAPRRAWAVDMLPAIPLARLVAASGSGSAVDAAFLAEQLATANELFADAGVTFDAADPVSIDQRFAELETRADRDSLGDSVVAHEVSIFFVTSLRDVDDPKNYRMGVTWRRLSDLTNKYIVVSSSARPTTMAHELGHYFGLDHTFVKNNLMSYDRDGGKVTLDPSQLQKIRRTATGALARKDLVPRS